MRLTEYIQEVHTLYGLIDHSIQTAVIHVRHEDRTSDKDQRNRIQQVKRP